MELTLFLFLSTLLVLKINFSDSEIEDFELEQILTDIFTSVIGHYANSFQMEFTQSQ